jgi:energy-coupling factor transport system ATP-binding protein
LAVVTVEIDGAQWTYGVTRDAAGGELHGIDLRAEQGEVVLLCGPSGSGKSSVLKLVNGLIPHFHDGTLTGSVRVAGRSVAETPLEDLGALTATVFQNPRTQFFTGHVASEIAFALENAGLPSAEIAERVRRAAAELGLGELLDRPLDRLSGGQQQLVACAVARAIDPQVYVFDEPTSNLAPDAIERIAALIGTCRREGRTVLIAEHRLAFLRGLVDRMLVVADGRIAAEYRAADFWQLSAGTRQRLGLRTFDAAGNLPGDHLPATSGAAGGLRLQGVWAGYRDRSVLDIDELAFPAGEVTALVGPNGAGKTTLARVICGLAASRGTITLDDRALTPRERLRRCYLVMQDVTRQLFTDSVRSEVLLGTPKKDRGRLEQRAEQVLADLELEALHERHPLSLSGGQKQRLVVATARTTRRDVYVFDEPTSGVDLKHLGSISTTLRSLAADGAVVIVITHDDELVAAAADRVVSVSPTVPKHRSPV